MSAELSLNRIADRTIERAAFKGRMARVVSTAVANLDPEQLIDQVKDSRKRTEAKGYLTPLKLHAGLQQLFAPVINSALEDHAGRSKRTFDELAGQHAWKANVLSVELQSFVKSGSKDAMAAVLSIPHRPVPDAFAIALSDESVRNFISYSKSASTELLFNTLSPSTVRPFDGDVRLRYKPSADHIAAEAVLPEGEGCPLAKHNGARMAGFYNLIAQVTIPAVEYFDGGRIYPDAA